MRNLSSFLIFTFFVCWSTTGSSSVSDKEMDTFLEAIKEKKDEELLIASPQFIDCSTLFKNFREDSSKKDEFSKCVFDKIIGDKGTQGADEKLLEIATNLGLQSFNKTAAKSTKSISDYLKDRLHKAVYGVENDEKTRQKLKDQKFVNHDVYYNMYAEQIGKNTLMDISNYCLENFSPGGKDSFLIVNFNKESKSTSFTKGSVSITKEGPDINESTKFSDKYELDQRIIDDPQTFITDATTPVINIWKNHASIEEYTICSFNNEKECKKQFAGTKKKWRSIRTVELLKNAEFALSKNDSKKKLITDRYNFCAGSVVKNMCELYRCKNVYNSASPEIERERCNKIFDIDVSTKDAKAFNDPTKQVSQEDLQLDSKDKKGFVACNLMNRLEEYRVVLKGIKGIEAVEKGLVSERGYEKRGFDVRTSFSGNYDGKGNGGKNIDKVLAISSKELTEKVKSLSNSEEEAEKLRKECMIEDPKDPSNFILNSESKDNQNCKMLSAKLNKVKFDTIQMDTEAKNALKMRQIEELASKEDLETFLKENGLEKYIGRLKDIEADGNGLNQIKNLISQDFKAKRLALIDGLKAKFEKERQLSVGVESQEEKNIELTNEIANQTIADVEQHKKRVETLFEYSNIVSSYLEIKDKDDKVIGTNVTSRTQELSDNQDLSSKYFSDSEDSSSSSGGGGIDYLQAIDQIVNFGDDKEKEKTP